jgi:hypothetical protein
MSYSLLDCFNLLYDREDTDTIIYMLVFMMVNGLIVTVFIMCLYVMVVINDVFAIRMC